MRKLSILILLTLLFCNLFAQKGKENNPLRFEVNIGTNSTESSPCVAINCEEYGVAVSYIITTASSGDSLVFVLKLLDVNMELFKETSFVLPADYYIRAHTYHKTNVFVALATSATRKNATDIMLMKFNVETGETSTLATSYDAPVSVNEITALHETALISLSDKKNRSHLLSMNFASQQSSFLYTSEDNNIYNILSLIRYPDEENIFVSMTRKTDMTYIFNLFEYSGGIMRLKFDKQLSDSVYLTYAAPLKNINGNIQSIIGAYYSGNIKNLYSSSDFGIASSGIYRIDATSSSLNLYPYRQNSKDVYYTWQKPLKYYDIDSLNTAYIFTAESYSPKYKVTPHTEYDFYGRPYTRYYQEFVGYTTLQASNYIFDNGGNLLWINNMAVENTINTNHPRRKVLVKPIDDEILNAYFAVDNLSYKFSSRNSGIEPIEKFYVAKKLGKDVVESEYDSKLEYWYDNNYFVYGYQVIKNNSLSKDSRRKVFYIQKIAL